MKLISILISTVITVLAPPLMATQVIISNQANDKTTAAVTVPNTIAGTGSCPLAVSVKLTSEITFTTTNGSPGYSFLASNNLAQPPATITKFTNAIVSIKKGQGYGSILCVYELLNISSNDGFHIPVILKIYPPEQYFITLEGNIWSGQFDKECFGPNPADCKFTFTPMPTEKN